MDREDQEGPTVAKGLSGLEEDDQALRIGDGTNAIGEVASIFFQVAPVAEGLQARLIHKALNLLRGQVVGCARVNNGLVGLDTGAKVVKVIEGPLADKLLVKGLAVLISVGDGPVIFRQEV